MNIHEYQAKELLRQNSVPVMNGRVAFSPEEAKTAFKSLKVPKCAIKAQIHAGGRGKAGGVKVISSPQEAEDFAKSMLGKKLVTHQTGPAGKEVQRLYLEAGCEIEKELYLSLLIDRSTGWPTFVSSAEGGVDIEEVAAKSPEKIIQVAIDPATGFQGYHGRKVAYGLGLDGKLVSTMVKFLKGVYQTFTSLDASMVEINPMVITKNQALLALDAKVSFDDNALYRHKDIQELKDESEEDPMELQASQHDLSYIKLDGSIGCMVNGAGLAMATMDAIKLFGGEPANFLDVGGGATTEKVTEAFKLILSDKNVDGILVNIFGGIMRCDIIAEGVLAAAREVSLSVPLVVRLEGTNVDQGKEILNGSDLKIIPANDLGDAAQKIVKAVKEAA